MPAPNKGIAKYQRLRKAAVKLGIPAKGSTAELEKAIKTKRASKGRATAAASKKTAPKTAPKTAKKAPSKAAKKRTESDGMKLHRALMTEAKEMGLKTGGKTETLKRRIAAARRTGGATPGRAPARRKRRRNGLFWNLYNR